MTRTYRLYFATNRGHQGNDRWRPERYTGEFSLDGAENLRFGKVEIDLEEAQVQECLGRDCGFGSGDGVALQKHVVRSRGTARIEAFKEKLNKEESDDEQKDAVLGSDRMFHELQKQESDARDILVFVHGFNVGWWNAVGSAMALELMLPQVMVVLFTWPSDGRTIPFWSYFSDRADARSSGLAVGRGFLKLRDFLLKQFRVRRAEGGEPCGRSVHLLCHSMGNYVLQSALKKTVEFSPSGKLPRLFDQIFLCAPDVSDDVFESGRPFSQLPRMAENVTVYHNRGDLAMPVSDYTKGNTDRLGWRGVNRPGELDGRVHVIDCSDIVRGAVEHNYYLAGRVNRDLAQSLDGLRPDAEERDRRAVQHGWPNVWRLR